MRSLEKAGLPADVRFHDLRRTAGTLAPKQGVPLHTVSKMLGHCDLAMTLRHHAHVAGEWVRGKGRTRSRSNGQGRVVPPVVHGELPGCVMLDWSETASTWIDAICSGLARV